MMGWPSYHDLHITTEAMGRTPLSRLPFRVEVHCSRTSGWEAWAVGIGGLPEELLGGEFGGPGKGLRLDVAGHVICNSLRDPAEEPR